MNIFKNIPDCIFYFLLIFAIPIIQCISLYNDADVMFFVTAILMVLGIAYDGFGRHNIKDSLMKQLLIIFGIYVVSAYLIGILIWFLIITLNGSAYPENYLLFYLPIAIPLIVENSCLVGHIKRCRERRKCTR